MAEMVSVALSVYNGALYLREQLDSILVQLKQQDEIVVAYQESDDTSREILESYTSKDPRVKVYNNPEKGITSNFNLAIQKCSGDFIFICDQDDVWVETKRDAVVNCFRKTGAVLVHHNAVHTDENLIPSQSTFFDIYPLYPGKVHNIVKPRMSGCCMAFTKDFKSVLLPIPEIWGYDQWVEVLAEFVGKTYYLDEVLLLHRLHGENVTTTTRKLGVIIKCRARLIWFLFVRIIKYRRTRK